MRQKDTWKSIMGDLTGAGITLLDVESAAAALKLTFLPDLSADVCNRRFASHLPSCACLSKGSFSRSDADGLWSASLFKHRPTKLQRACTHARSTSSHAIEVNHNRRPGPRNNSEHANQNVHSPFRFPAYKDWHSRRMPAPYVFTSTLPCEVARTKINTPLRTCCQSCSPDRVQAHARSPK